MAVNEPRRWLIAYDIRDPRRLNRVHRLLAKAAIPVQYSVFAAAGSRRAMQDLAARLEQEIDVRVDDVRFYPVPQPAEVYTIGATMLPQDVLVLDDRLDLEELLRPRAPAAGGRGPSAPKRRGMSSTAAPSMRGESAFKPVESESLP